MPDDLTGHSIQDVYNSFLHLSGSLEDNNAKTIYDGVGNSSPLQLATNYVNITGTLIVNGLYYPRNFGTTGDVMVLSGQELKFRSLSNVISDNISSVVQAISTINNEDSRLFFISSRNKNEAGPGLQVLINAISWTSPFNGNVAFVLQKVKDGTTMIDLDVFKLVFSNTTGWTLTQTF